MTNLIFFEDEGMTTACYTLADEGKRERVVQRYNAALRPEFQGDSDRFWAIFDIPDFDDEMYTNGYASVEISSWKSVSGHTTEVTFWPEDFDDMDSEIEVVR